jgi:hypothetical protein
MYRPGKVMVAGGAHPEPVGTIGFTQVVDFTGDFSDQGKWLFMNDGSRPAFCGKAEMESPVSHGSRLRDATLRGFVDDPWPATQITPPVNLTKAELTHRDQSKQQREC